MKQSRLPPRKDSGLLRCTRNDEGWISGAPTERDYLPPPLLSRNTACSPNMFHTHHGRFSGTGRP